jgi:hypothetical protein
MYYSNCQGTRCRCIDKVYRYWSCCCINSPQQWSRSSFHWWYGYAWRCAPIGNNAHQSNDDHITWRDWRVQALIFAAISATSQAAFIFDSFRQWYPSALVIGYLTQELAAFVVLSVFLKVSQHTLHLFVFTSAVIRWSASNRIDSFDIQSK